MKLFFKNGQKNINLVKQCRQFSTPCYDTEAGEECECLFACSRWLRLTCGYWQIRLDHV